MNNPVSPIPVMPVDVAVLLILICALTSFCFGWGSRGWMVKLDLRRVRLAYEQRLGVQELAYKHHSPESDIEIEFDAEGAFLGIQQKGASETIRKKFTPMLKSEPSPVGRLTVLLNEESISDGRDPGTDAAGGTVARQGAGECECGDR